MKSGWEKRMAASVKMKLNPLKDGLKHQLLKIQKQQNCCGTQGGRKNCESTERRHGKPGVLLLKCTSPHLNSQNPGWPWWLCLSETRVWPMPKVSQQGHTFRYVWKQHFQTCFNHTLCLNHEFTQTSQGLLLTCHLVILWATSDAALYCASLSNFSYSCLLLRI